MKKVLFFLAALISCYASRAQFLLNDSLQGFDLNKTVNEVNQKNLNSLELKLYVNRAKREFVNTKYHLQVNEPEVISTSKYGSNTTFNIPCVNEDFESSPTGTLAPSTWTSQQGTGNSYVCTGTSSLSLYSNTSAVVVYTTPLTDAICGTVSNSPFGGTKIVKINDSGFNLARLKQSFPVTSSNWLFNYAYMGVLSQQTHGCCDDAFLMFRFFDCSGNPISSLSQTVVLGTPTCVATSSNNWALSTVSVSGWPTAYTTNWKIVSLNLSAYTGSCLTVELTASACSFGSHPGYMYFDANCSNGGAMIVNGTTYLSPASDYTSCTTSTTLSALPGFSSYQWQGPSASGVSGNTNTAITTSISGIYTVVANTGTITSTQTLNLVVSSTSITITGNNNICNGQTTTLQVTGSSLNSYSWSNTSTLQSVSVNPSITTVYSIVTTNTAGCIANASQTVTVFSTSTTIVGNTTICSGQTATLQVTGSALNSYSWSNTSTLQSVSVNPSITTVYSVLTTNTAACISTASQTVTVLPVPLMSISSNTTAICNGQNISLSAFASGINSFTWSTGVVNSSITISPTLTSAYTVSGTTSGGCLSYSTNTITVFPSPQLQVTQSSPTICAGQSATFIASGISGNSYNWSNGSTSNSIVVSPSLTSVYSVTASTNVGCLNLNSNTLSVYPLPQVQIITSNTEICIGELVNLGVIGNNIAAVLWNTGASSATISVSPINNSVYSLIVTSTQGCNSTQSTSINVNSLPQAQIVSSSPSICVGQSATLSVTGSGIIYYQWNGSQITSSIIVSPTVSSQFTVMVTDSKGCSSNSSFDLVVVTCTTSDVGMREFELNQDKLIIYPNPTDGTFEIKGSRIGKGILINDIGQIISEFFLTVNNNFTFKVVNLAKGVYFVKNAYGSEKIIVK